MGAKATPVKSPKAILTLVMVCDSDMQLPDKSDLERIIGEAQCYGRVTVADWEVTRPIKESLI